MACEVCGFDIKKSLGKFLEKLPGGYARVELNSNGLLWVNHRRNCIKDEAERMIQREDLIWEK